MPAQPYGAARITATRSVREAWACFLSFTKDRANHSKSDSFNAYAAMFEKLFANTSDDRYANRYSTPYLVTVAKPFRILCRNRSSFIIESEPPDVLQLYQYMRG